MADVTGGGGRAGGDVWSDLLSVSMTVGLEEERRALRKYHVNDKSRISGNIRAIRDILHGHLKWHLSLRGREHSPGHQHRGVAVGGCVAGVEGEGGVEGCEDVGDDGGGCEGGFEGGDGDAGCVFAGAVGEGCL